MKDFPALSNAVPSLLFNKRCQIHFHLAIKTKSMPMFRTACPLIRSVSYLHFLASIHRSTGSSTARCIYENKKKNVLVVCIFKLIFKQLQNLHIQSHTLVEYFFCKSRRIWSPLLLEESKCLDDLSFFLGNLCTGFIPTSVMYRSGLGSKYCLYT